MNYELKLGDTLERMSEIPDGSIDMICTDLPYGTTNCRWDSVIPFEPLWEAYRRVTKKNAAIVLTASQPFTSALVMSNVKDFKYDWTWRKPKGTGHLNAKKMPMRDKEDIVVFYQEQCTYNPQMTTGTPYAAKGGEKQSENWGEQKNRKGNDNSGLRYPKQVQEWGAVEQTVHPTQKPVALMEYLIRTYTNPGELVLDNTMGSGTTGVACMNTGRRFIGIERDENYFAICQERVHRAYVDSIDI
jgi:DNA modification methylase